LFVVAITGLLSLSFVPIGTRYSRWTNRVKSINVLFGMETSRRVKKPRRGRPRSFDVDRALDRALQVFWRKGYEGASLPELTRAMGINRPSMYAAFGNKAALFRKVLDRYAQGPAHYVCAAIEAPTAREVFERILRGAVKMAADPRNPKGCLNIQGALACGSSAEAMRKELIARRARGQEALRQRFERAKEEGDLPSHVDAADLARYVTTVIYGLSVQAVSGASAEDLRRIGDMALRVFPN
jgi:AcrR family transcriptional regulator